MLNNQRIVFRLLFVAALALAPASAGDKADLSRLVVVGDSLSAGYQNSSLWEPQQTHGYAAMVAAQARVNLPLPLIGNLGMPPVLILNPAPPPLVVRASTDPNYSAGRTNPTVQPMNLAVPGHRVEDALNARPGSVMIDPVITYLTILVLGVPAPPPLYSQVEWAEHLNPTTIICWLGNNDALLTVLNGSEDGLTEVAKFQTDYAKVLDRLSATGAKLVVANIPDLTTVPFLTPAEKVVPPALFAVLGIGPGDYVLPDAIELIPLILQGVVPGPLPANYVLDKDEAATVSAAIRFYNAIIAAQAQARGAVLVDINALTSQLHRSGHVAGGRRLTTDFLGGLFSLDGVHPTNTGYALIANEFIRQMNTRLGTGIPPVNVEKVSETDPLIPPGAGRPASALGMIGAEAARSLRTARAH